MMLFYFSLMLIILYIILYITLIPLFKQLKKKKISSRDQVFIYLSINYSNDDDKTTGLSLTIYCGIFCVNSLNHKAAENRRVQQTHILRL